MATNEPARMTLSQHAALCSANADGLLTWTDRRVIKALIRRGWAREHVGRRGRRSWYITETGQMALDSAPVIAPPRIRPNWRHWDHERVAQGHYVVEGHELIRPAQGMLWRVCCPRVPDEPVGHANALAEAVELLAGHLTGIGASSRGT